MLITEKAMRLALRAHAGQTNKTDDTPYIVHPVMVALMLSRNGFSETTVAAALVHDVLEDTEVSEKELEEVVGSEVLSIVKEVSEDKELVWEERKNHYLESVRMGSLEAKAVSLCDKIHNLERLFTAYENHGAAVWNFFNRKKPQKLGFEDRMLAMFRKSFDHQLVSVYAEMLAKAHTLAD